MLRRLSSNQPHRQPAQRTAPDHTNAPATNAAQSALAPNPPRRNASLPKNFHRRDCFTNTAAVSATRSIQPNVNISSICGRSIAEFPPSNFSTRISPGRTSGSSPRQHHRPRSILQRTRRTPEKSLSKMWISRPSVRMSGIRPATASPKGSDLDSTMKSRQEVDSKNVITLDQFTFGDRVEARRHTSARALAIAHMKMRRENYFGRSGQGSLDDPQSVSQSRPPRVVNILEKPRPRPSRCSARCSVWRRGTGYHDFRGKCGFDARRKQK